MRLSMGGLQSLGLRQHRAQLVGGEHECGRRRRLRSCHVALDDARHVHVEGSLDVSYGGAAE